MAATARLPINLHSDDSVLLVGPDDVSDPSAPAPITSPTHSELRVYDVENQPCVLMDGDSSADTDTFLVISQDLFVVGQTLAVRDDSNEVFTADVQSVDPDARTITLDASLTGGAFIPNRTEFFVFPGAVINGALYGTPVAENDDWGYAHLVPHDAPGLYHNQNVIAEIDFDGGTGLRVVIELAALILKANP